MEIPNVVNMIFGRIDRNSDTQYRDKALGQNDRQFNLGQQLDRERLAAQQEEFNKRINFEKAKQAAAEEAALAEAVNKGLVSAEGGGPTSAPTGGMNNMFMPPDGSAPGMGGIRPLGQGAAQPSVPGMPVTIAGRRVNAVPQSQLFATQLQQSGQAAQQQYVAAQRHKADTFNFLHEAGIPEVYAAMAAENPHVMTTILSDPKIAVGLLSTGKNVPKPVMDAFLQGFQSAANAGVPDAQKAELNARSEKDRAEAAWYLKRQANEPKAATPGGNLLYGEAYAAAGAKYAPTDPKFTVEVYKYINENMRYSLEDKASALAATQKDLIGNRFIGETWFDKASKLPSTLNGPGIVQTPPPNPQSQPTTGAGGNNNKPPEVTGPVGTQRRPTGNSLDFLFNNRNPIPRPAAPPPTPMVPFNSGNPQMDEMLKQLMMRPPQQ